MYKTRVNVITVDCEQTYGDRNNTVFGFSYGELQLGKSCVRCDIFLYIKLFFLCVFFCCINPLIYEDVRVLLFKWCTLKSDTVPSIRKLLAPSLVLSLVYNYSFINLSVFFLSQQKTSSFPNKFFIFLPSFMWVYLWQFNVLLWCFMKNRHFFSRKHLNWPWSWTNEKFERPK